MVELYKKYYHKLPINICADSGYGVFDNYEYLKSNSINAYIKYLKWSGERNGKNPQFFYLNDDEKILYVLMELMDK